MVRFRFAAPALATLPLAALPLALVSACGGSQKEAAPAEIAATTEAAAPAPSSETASETPSAGGAPAAFAVCAACHAVAAGQNGVGPTLFGILGSKAGEVPGYVFSDALKTSGIVWDRDKLDTWLKNPMQMVPGTKMVNTVASETEREAIIDYLETLK